jgi:hypothetical protein
MNFVHSFEKREFLDASPPLFFFHRENARRIKRLPTWWLPPYQCRVRGSHPYIGCKWMQQKSGHSETVSCGTKQNVINLRFIGGSPLHKSVGRPPAAMGRARSIPGMVPFNALLLNDRQRRRLSISERIHFGRLLPASCCGVATHKVRPSRRGCPSGPSLYTKPNKMNFYRSL